MALNYGILAIYKQIYAQNLAIMTKSVIYGSIEFYETGPRGTVLQIIIGYLIKFKITGKYCVQDNSKVFAPEAKPITIVGIPAPLMEVCTLQFRRITK